MRTATVVRRTKLEELYGRWVIAVEGQFSLAGRREIKNIDHFTELIEGTMVELASNCNMVGFKMVNLVNLTNYHYLVIPRNIITTEQIQDAIDLLAPKLDELMPGRWYYQSGYLHLAYPELTLKNSNDEEHKVYDLVVRIKLNNDGSSDGYIYGDRFSFSVTEMLNGYTHSHLPRGNNRGASGGFQAFCVGSGSHFADLLSRMARGFTAQNLELFLFQLEMYLSWESLEGTPYISLSGLERNPAFQGSFASLSVADTSLMRRMAKDYLGRLTYHLLDFHDNRWIFDPGAHATRAYEIEQLVTQEFIRNGEMRTALLHDFNENDQHYVAGSSTTMRLPNHAHGDMPNRLNLNPRVITDDAPVTTGQPIVKRLSPPALKQLFTELDLMLLNGYKNNE